MAEERIALETAALTAADTETAMSEFCGTTVTMVTPNTTRLKHIRVSLASDGAATGAGVYFIELGGAGFPGGPHRITIGGIGGTLATSGIQVFEPIEIDLDIVVKASSTFTCSAYANVDTGTVSVAVELVFQT